MRSNGPQEQVFQRVVQTAMQTTVSIYLFIGFSDIRHLSTSDRQAHSTAVALSSEIIGSPDIRRITLRSNHLSAFIWAG